MRVVRINGGGATVCAAPSYAINARGLCWPGVACDGISTNMICDINSP